MAGQIVGDALHQVLSTFFLSFLLSPALVNLGLPRSFTLCENRLTLVCVVQGELRIPIRILMVRALTFLSDYFPTDSIQLWNNVAGSLGQFH